MTPERYDELLKEHTRTQMIPGYVDGVLKWLAEIRRDAADIRNSPDIQRRQDGSTFVSMVTDLASIEKAALRLLEIFNAGEFELAVSAMSDLRGRVDQAHRRLEARALAHGKKKLPALDESREKHNAEKSNDAKKRWAGWQDQANAIWLQNPNLNASAVARVIATKTGESQSTIRHRIKKPGHAG